MQSKGIDSPTVRETREPSPKREAHLHNPREPLSIEKRDLQDPTSRFKGVQWDKKGKRWRVRLHTDRTRHVGYYADDVEAAKAWDQAFLRYNSEPGVIDKLNFPEESYAAFKEFISTTGDVDQFDLRGVSKAGNGQFRSLILQNRIHKTIGTFPTARQAATAYDWKSICVHGWGALTNFPIKSYQMEYVRNGGISPLDRTPLPSLPSPNNSGIQCSMMLQMQHPTYPGILPLDALQQVLQQAPPALTSPDYQEQVRQLCAILSIPPDHLLNNEKAHLPGEKDDDGVKNQNEKSSISKVAENQWRASITVDLGVFSSEKEAEIACKRSSLVADGYGSAVEPSKILEHFEHIKSNRSFKSKSIIEKDGLYYTKLRIKGRAFEVGPYATFDEAALAHDKYKLVVNGMVTDTFNSLIHILLSEEDASMLLDALNLSTTSMPEQHPQVTTPTVQYTHPTLYRVGSMTTLGTSLPVNGVSIPRVGSQTSLQEGGIELRKQLEEIESSIEGIHGHKRIKVASHATPEPRHRQTNSPSTAVQNQEQQFPQPLPTVPVDNAGDAFPLPTYPRQNNDTSLQE